jgi:hypothetical protein
MINTKEEGIAYETKPTFITTEIKGKPPSARLPIAQGSANAVLSVASRHRWWQCQPAAALAEVDTPHLLCKINRTSPKILRLQVDDHPRTLILALNLSHVHKCSGVGVGPAVEPVEKDDHHIGRPSVPGVGSAV